MFALPALPRVVFSGDVARHHRQSAHHPPICSNSASTGVTLIRSNDLLAAQQTVERSFPRLRRQVNGQPSSSRNVARRVTGSRSTANRRAVGSAIRIARTTRVQAVLGENVNENENDNQEEKAKEKENGSKKRPSRFTSSSSSSGTTTQSDATPWALQVLVGAATAALDLLTPRTDPVTNPQAQEPSSSSSSSTISANAATAATAGNAAMWSSEATDAEDCRGVLRELVEAIREDYEQRAYFVTGAISARFYDTECLFADPTIQFSGLQRWQRNIALLTRFFSSPTIHLHDLQVFPATPSSAARLETRWRLLTPINLPWRPLVDIRGSTVHTLNAAGTKVVSHVEAWEVSAYEAIMHLFRPGPPAPPSLPDRPEPPSAPGSP